jgi:hypothetical protein
MIFPILGCPTCAKNFADHGANAAGFSILFLLVVIVGVMASVAFCMIRLARRQSRAMIGDTANESSDTHLH